MHAKRSRTLALATAVLAAGAALAGPTWAAPGDRYSQDSHFCGPASDPSVNPQHQAYNDACVGGFPAKNAFDGDLSSFWASDARPCAAPGGHWVQAVFAKPRTGVGTVTLIGTGTDAQPFDVLEDVTITAGPKDKATDVIAQVTGNRKPVLSIKLKRKMTIGAIRVTATKCFYNWAYGYPAAVPGASELRSAYSSLPFGDTTRAGLYEVALKP